MENFRMLFTPTGLHIREAAEGNNDSRIIEGCAIVFDKETVLWDGKYERIREVIAPSCVTEEFLAEQDIKLNLLHDRSMSVARCNRGEGTLKLDLRKDGLYFSAEMPRCDLGDQCLELVKNGTYTGCSFEFYAKDYKGITVRTEDGRDDTLIRHTAFESIQALTIAMDPAYNQTSVNVREQARMREEKRNLEQSEKEAGQAREQEKQRLYHQRQQTIAQIRRETELD